MSKEGQALAKKFVDENGQITNEHPLVFWDRDEEMDAFAAELLVHHEGSLELDQLEKEANKSGGSLRPGKMSSNGAIEHLGEGVQLGRTDATKVPPIDPDSMRTPHTITRRDQRATVWLAIETVANPRNFSKVTVIGQPGIGKTRGGLTYALGELLWRGEAVLRVGYKDGKAYLFLPDENGEYRVWVTTAEDWNRSRVAADKRAYALIDPPEKADGGYADAPACHVIKYASNDEEKHYKNYYKDGYLLVSALPTKKEGIVMVPILWNAKTTPYPDQVADNADRFSTLEAKEEETNLRYELAGTVLRAVFDHKKFADHIDAVVDAAVKDSLDMDDRRFLAHVWGTVTTTKGHSSSASSVRFLLDSVHDDPTKEKMHIRLSPTALHVSRLELTKKTAETDSRQAFTFEETTSYMLEGGGKFEHTTFPRRTLVTPRPKKWKETAKAILNLPVSGEQLVIASANFPVLDQAASRFVWFNAKTGKTAPIVDAMAFHKLMTGILKMAKPNEHGGLTLVADEDAARAEKLKGTGKKLITLTFLMQKVPEKWTPNKHTFNDNTEGKFTDDTNGIAVNFKRVKKFFEDHIDVISVDCSKIHYGPADPAATAHLAGYSREYAQRYT